MKKRAVLYFRQSNERDDSISPDVQRESCTAYAAPKYDILAQIEDEGRSGTESVLPWQKREDFQQVMALAEAGDVDVIVIYRWSRLSRTRRAQIEMTDLLEAQGVVIEAATESFDPTTAGGRFARDQMYGYTAFESDLKSEQWKEALNRRVANGLPKNGHLRFDYAKHGKTFVPDPVTGPILREIYLRYTKRAGFQTLVKDLNERGIPTTRGGTWCVATLLRALDSGFGAGLLKASEGKPFDIGSHESVITEDEWTAYLRMRESRRKQLTKRQGSKCFLSGLVRCGKCGGVALVDSYPSAKSEVICSAYKNTRTCDGIWMKRVLLENRWRSGSGATSRTSPARPTTTPHEVRNAPRSNRACRTSPRLRTP